MEGTPKNKSIKRNSNSNLDENRKSKRKYSKSDSFETTDGYFWAQYGVKILSNSSKRIYYRCRSKSTGCRAKKKADYAHGECFNVEYNENHNHNPPEIPHRHVVFYDLSSNTVVHEAKDHDLALTEQQNVVPVSPPLVLSQKTVEVRDRSSHTGYLELKGKGLEMVSPTSVFDAFYEPKTEPSLCVKLERGYSDTFCDLGALVEASWLENL